MYSLLTAFNNKFFCLERSLGDKMQRAAGTDTPEPVYAIRIIVPAMTFVALTLIFSGCASESIALHPSPANQALTDEFSLLLDIQHVKSAANRDFPSFLDAAWGQKEDYGFETADEKKNISLGQPVCVYGLDQATVETIKNADELISNLKPVGEWIFPVCADDSYRTLYGVRLRKNEWRGSYLGNPYLAKSLQDIRKVWSKNQHDKFILVSCVQPRSFYFNATEEKLNLTPITPITSNRCDSIQPPGDWKNITPLKVVLKSLKCFWEENNIDGIILENGNVSQGTDNKQ